MSTLKKLPIKFNDDGCSLVITNLTSETTEAELFRLADECIGCRIFEKELTDKNDSTKKFKKYTGYLKFSSNTMAMQNLYKLRGKSVNNSKLFVRIKKSREQLEVERKQEERQRAQEAAERARERRRKIQEERARALEEAKHVLQPVDEPHEPRVQEIPEKYFQVQRQPRETPVDQQDWTCPECKVYNFFSRKNCLKCKTERRWICKKCNESISINNTACGKCKAPRDPARQRSG